MVVKTTLTRSRIEHIPSSDDDLTNENARVKHVLKENGYQETIISKIFKGITNNHNNPQTSKRTNSE